MNNIQSKRKQDGDLNGIAFTDTPWLLKSNTPGNSIQTAIQKNWPDAGDKTRLFALGVDAYNLLPFITKLQEDREFFYTGATGDLHLDPTGRIRRALHWAIYEKGKAKLYDSATRPIVIDTDTPPKPETPLDQSGRLNELI